MCQNGNSGKLVKIMTEKYTTKETHAILSNSYLYCDADGSHIIEYVPDYDSWINGEDSIYMIRRESGCRCYFDIDDIDLNDPETLVYKLVLANRYEN